MRKLFGTSGVLLAMATAIGCSVPPATKSVATIQTPTAAAKLTASSRTKQATGITSWRIYRGAAQVVAMGFDANKKPVEGVRFMTSTEVPFQIYTMKTKAQFSISAKGVVKKGHFSKRGKAHVAAAFRALRSYLKTQSPGGALTKAFVAFDDCQSTRDDFSNDCGNAWNTCFDSSKTWSDCGGAAKSCGGSAGSAGRCKILGPTTQERKDSARADKEVEDFKKQLEDDSKTTTAKPDDAEDPKNPDDVEQDPPDPPQEGEPTPDPQTDESTLGSSDGDATLDPNDPNADPDGQSPISDGEGENESADSADVSNDAESPDDASTDDADPNAGDPDATADADSSNEEPETTDDGASGGNTPEDDGTVAASLRFQSLKGSTSLQTAKKVGGACRSRHYVQCGVRKGVPFCRCAPL